MKVSLYKITCRYSNGKYASSDIVYGSYESANYIFRHARAMYPNCVCTIEELG